jgi:serine/threonine protein kinase
MAMLNCPEHEDMSSLEASVHSSAPRKASFKSLYRVTDQVLGSGLNGEVKLAVHRETGQKVALKSYATEKMGARQIGDLVREVRTQSSLKHPNVANVEAVFQSRDSMRLLVEHLSGGSVFDHIFEEGAFSEGHAARVLRQLLSAVEHVHASGLVHRDIKPENMVYVNSDKEEAKLIDFGFCCYWSEGENPMTRRCGTEVYMAPEVMRQHGYTSQADMWSVGVTAHVLLTGEFPGRDRHWAPVLSERLGECSAEAQKFVASLLTVDPASRLTAQKALTQKWLLSEHHGKAPCNMRCDSDASTDVGRSSMASSTCDDFSGLFPSSKPSTAKRGKKSIWQALPTFGAARRVGAALAAVRTCRSRRASVRVSVEVDL